MATPPKPVLADLLKHFDQETATVLASAVQSGETTVEHIRELVRLTSQAPQYRSAEQIESLLEDAEDMDIEGFKAWVDQMIKEAREA